MERRSMEHNPMQNSAALVQISALEQQVLTTGRTDSERGTIHDIKTRLYRNEISPEQAIAEMEGLIAKRQDYN